MIQGYVTAASTPEGQEYGYVFSKCRIVSEECQPGSVYLGRPWRDYAKTIFIDCSFGAHIHPALFHDWGKEQARKTLFYGVSGCQKGSERTFPEKADFVQELTQEEIHTFSKEKVLFGEDGWLAGENA